jgi:hypothetical protein
LRKLGTAAGLQSSAWSVLVEVGDETDICLDVCQRTKITNWGQMQEALRAIEKDGNWWKDWLRLLAHRCEESGERAPFNRPWLVFSIIRLLDSPHMPSIDVMYEPLWSQIEALHAEVQDKKTAARESQAT